VSNAGLSGVNPDKADQAANLHTVHVERLGRIDQRVLLPASWDGDAEGVATLWRTGASFARQLLGQADLG